MSRLLARLEGTGPIAKRPTRRGCANAWSLTEEGVRVARALEEGLRE